MIKNNKIIALKRTQLSHFKDKHVKNNKTPPVLIALNQNLHQNNVGNN